MPPTTDATPTHLDKNAGDSSAQSNLFADFLKTSDADFKNQGSTTVQILANMDRTLAGGESAFRALPQVQLPEDISKSDRNFNVVAALQPGNNSMAEDAMSRAFKNAA